MSKSLCRHRETKEVSDVGDAGTSLLITCVACGAVTQEFDIIDREDGTTIRRPKMGVVVKNSGNPKKRKTRKSTHKPTAGDDLEESIGDLSADDMDKIANDFIEKNQKIRVNLLKQRVLIACKKAAQTGAKEGAYLVTEADPDLFSSKIIDLTIKELKGLKYKVTKEPCPGEGVWINVKWKRSQTKKTPQSS